MNKHIIGILSRIDDAKCYAIFAIGFMYLFITTNIANGHFYYHFFSNLAYTGH